MSSALPKDRQKCEMNSEPLSEVTCEGTPCLEKTCRTKSWASSCEVTVSVVGIKSACLVNQSTTTNIAV